MASNASEFFIIASTRNIMRATYFDNQIQAKTALSAIGDQKEDMEAKRDREMDEKNEESERTDGGSARPLRAAAGIARCKIKLMLDHA